MSRIPSCPNPDYVELHCLSNFSFLKGASFPEELINRALTLGYRGLALTDECSMAGVVRAHMAVKSAGAQAEHFKLIIGSEFVIEDDIRVVLLAQNRSGYGRICALITQCRQQAEKGSYRLDFEQLLTAPLNDTLLLWVAPVNADNSVDFIHRSGKVLQQLKQSFEGRLWIAAEFFLMAGDAQRKLALRQLSAQMQIPVCAAGGVQMHHSSRRPLRDVLTAIRVGKPVEELGFLLPANAQQTLRSREMLVRLFPADWLQETLVVAERCHFSLNELRYEYPHELVPENYTPSTWLRQLTEQGLRTRWPEGAPAAVLNQVERELTLIAELRYEHFFLTVHDIVQFARSRDILCQGRGSAANSAVCYCLGITAVDPARMQLLFERFLSRERDEPPDIDVDFEHERREEVIQYVYQKYGRQRAALAATVICYRSRSAVRDVCKAMGVDINQISALPPSKLAQIEQLVEQLVGFPRHLSQHVGGFVISEGPLWELVPVENASMPDRTVIQWEKDDLEALGLLKVDVLALGMLTAIHRALRLLPDRDGKPWQLADVPAEDERVYQMMCKADTIGVFQIESRAQMSMLPRLRPENFYDLVVQIAIVRPGPIQGDMVHPYLARKQGLEKVSYPSEAVRNVLQRTLGVPIFQEQVMQIAMVAAGFTGGEADQLRRAMAAWKRKGGLEPFKERLVSGMLERGYEKSFALQIYQQIKGFGEYGFPESHSASFALLAYVSSWLKCYYPATFVCALINSQPMGFYPPSQLVQDLRRHNVKVLPVDVMCSEWDCSLEPDPGQNNGENKALRLGLRMVKGLSGKAATRLLAARRNRMFVNVEDLVRRAALANTDTDALAAADALQQLSGDRYRAFWDVSGVEQVPELFESIAEDFGQHSAATLMLPKPGEAQNILADYNYVGLSLRRHPLALWRAHLDSYQVSTAAALADIADGSKVKTAGLVTCRQRPQTASGVTFLTLEDESGFVNVVVWAGLLERYGREVHEASVLGITGHLQHAEGVTHLIATTLVDLSHWFAGMALKSRDFT